MLLQIQSTSDTLQADDVYSVTGGDVAALVAQRTVQLVSSLVIFL